MSNLLNKPFKSFAWYALLILMCSIPVYYWVVDMIWLEELDEHNQIIRARIEDGSKKIELNTSDLSKTLEAWNSIQPGTKLIRVKPSEVKADRLYTTMKYNRYEKEMNRFRVLTTFIEIQGEPYRLTVATNVEEADETLVAIAVVTILFFILLIGGFVVLNRRISRKIWKPFRETLDRLKRFDLRTQETIVFESSGITEFEALNRELTDLIEKNIRAFRQQKTFIENASHELQTPLAILKTKTDLLLQNEQLTAEQADLLTAIANNLSRVTRINKNLLLLAKIENNQFSETSATDVSAIVNDSAEMLSDYLSDKRMRLDINCPKYNVEANATMLEVLFNNLLINAIFHGQQGDTLRVVLTENTLVFSNSGAAALNEERLFKRFAVSSSETTRSGLGLSIAQEICNRYGWQLSYRFAEQRHFFSIRF